MRRQLFGSYGRKKQPFLDWSLHNDRKSFARNHFSESGGAAVPPGVSVGDPHLVTFRGTHYDLMDAGEFVLVKADPDLVVQTRLRLTTPNVAVNSAVAAKIGQNAVAVCPAGIEVNGKQTPLDDGKSMTFQDGASLSRRGNVFAFSRAGGDVVQVTNFVDHMDVNVNLGTTNPQAVKGLLGSAESGGLVSASGEELRPPVSQSTFQRYADSWRVPPAESILCTDGKVAPEHAKKPFYARDLEREERARAQKICTEAGVQEGPLLDDCTLDVAIIGKKSAADAFVHANRPVRTIRISP